MFFLFKSELFQNMNSIPFGTDLIGFSLGFPEILLPHII